MGYSAEQKEAMQARSQWNKKKLMAKALMDVVQGTGEDGDGKEYLTHYRIASAAWTHFCGGETAPYSDRRTKAFDQYMIFLKVIAAGWVRAQAGVVPAPSKVQQPKLRIEPRVEQAAPPVTPTPRPATPSPASVEQPPVVPSFTPGVVLSPRPSPEMLLDPKCAAWRACQDAFRDFVMRGMEGPEPLPEWFADMKWIAPPRPERERKQA